MCARASEAISLHLRHKWHHACACRRAAAMRRLRKARVAEVSVKRRVEQDVGRLEIAVQHARLERVQIDERVHRLTDRADLLPPCERPRRGAEVAHRDQLLHVARFQVQSHLEATADHQREAEARRLGVEAEQHCVRHVVEDHAAVPLERGDRGRGRGSPSARAEEGALPRRAPGKKPFPRRASRREEVSRPKRSRIGR